MPENFSANLKSIFYRSLFCGFRVIVKCQLMYNNVAFLHK